MVALGIAMGLAVWFKRKDERPEAAGEVTKAIKTAPTDIFADVTQSAGIGFVHQFCDDRIANILQSNGSGGVWFDYDNDGNVDLYLVNSGPEEGITHHVPGTVRQPNRLYRNLGNGKFQDVTASAGVAGKGYGFAACAADYDNDGRVDLYVVNAGKSILYRNLGNARFEDVTAKADVANEGGTGIGAVFLDADNDGWLDLFVANYLRFDPSYKSSFHPESPYPGPLAYAAQPNRLYRNLGDGRFEDVSEAAGVRFSGQRAMSVTVFDCNEDGAPDIYLSNDGTPNQLLVNDGHGRFRDAGLESGVAFNAMGEAAGSMAAAVGDCDGDGRQDLFVSRLGYGSLYLAREKGGFEDQMMASGLGALTREYVGWGNNFLDMDNDGDLDLLIANGDALYLLGAECLLLENDGQGGFVDAGAKAGMCFRVKVRGRGTAVADYDNDGRVDAIVTTIADRPLLMKNQATNDHQWLSLKLEGTRSNRDGFGARIRVSAGGKEFRAQSRCAFGFLMQSDSRVHFGLGQSRQADRIEILWPSGQKQELREVKAGQVLIVKEPGERTTQVASGGGR